MKDRQKQFEQENGKLLLYRLMSSFNKLNNKVLKHCGRALTTPRFVMKRGRTVWGFWNAHDRKLALSVELLHNFEWEAVEFVLAHEMAHMIQTEIFGIQFDGRAMPHGESFSKACKILEIDDRRCSSPEFLAGFKGVGNELPIVDKIRKLMAKGSCTEATEAEAEIFMRKAQQLMRAHNLSNTEIMGTEKVFVQRPVGGMHKRFPTWLWRLGDLVSKHYGVQNIRTFAYDRDGNFYRYLELFGEPHKVDVAEYVFHVVMAQGEALYEKHKKDPNRRHGWRKLSKRSFMEGLIEGYADTLRGSEWELEEQQTDEENALLLADDKMLQERYHKAYPNLRTTRHAGSRGAGRGAGQAAGAGIKVRAGVGGGGGRLQIGG